MFIKKILSYIFAHILLLGGVKTQVYVAPPEVKVVATSSIVTTGATTKPTVVQKQATTTKNNIKSQSKPVIKAAPKTLTATTTTKTLLTLPIVDFEVTNTYARNAIVNILCTTKGGELSPISGSGVVVTPGGLIITNAHIGQYFLLRDFPVKDSIECVARIGSPAYPKYKLELVYISPTWVANNKSLLKETDPKGTGENDFAFLRITGMIDGTNMPDSVPFLHMDIREDLNKTEPVLLESYPAGFLGGITILQDLSITSAVTTIQEIYTFSSNTVDLIAVPGTVVSQKGSSGGAVIDKYATLIGIITTSSAGVSTSDRALNAITIPYVNRSIENDLGITLAQFVDGDTAEFAKTFQRVNAPNLTKLITDELNKN